jgi:hypothetical protein
VARGTRRGAHAAIPGPLLSIDLPFALETDVERRIAAEPEWQEGVEWGRPRRGHPEGSVKQHIADVLANVEREASSQEERRRLRLAALVHDSFKYRAPEASVPVGSPRHHGALAAKFLARFVDDRELVLVVYWHDEAFAAAQQWRRANKGRAKQRVQALVERLGPALPLYAKFFRADNATGDKDQRSVEWFDGLVRKWTG